MTELITAIISTYSFNHQYLDKNALTVITEELIKTYSLEDYIKKTVIYDLNEENQTKESGSYSFLNRKIVVNIPLLYKHVEAIIKNNESPVREEEKYFEFNIRLLEALLHEVEHAKQFKNYIESKDNDIEKKVLSYFFENLVQLEKTKDLNNPYHKDIANLNKLDKFYVYSPSERMADISSSKEVIKIFPSEEFKDFKIAKIYYYILHTFRETRGYDIDGDTILSPTAKFKYEYEQVRKKYGERLTRPIQSLEEIYFMKYLSDLNIEQRLYYGLPITMDEHGLILEKRKKLMDLYQ